MKIKYLTRQFHHNSQDTIAYNMKDNSMDLNTSSLSMKPKNLNSKLFSSHIR